MGGLGLPPSVDHLNIRLLAARPGFFPPWTNQEIVSELEMSSKPYVFSYVRYPIKIIISKKISFKVISTACLPSVQQTDDVCL